MTCKKSDVQPPDSILRSFETYEKIDDENIPSKLALGEVVEVTREYDSVTAEVAVEGSGIHRFNVGRKQGNVVVGKNGRKAYPYDAVKNRCDECGQEKLYDKVIEERYCPIHD